MSAAPSSAPVVAPAPDPFRLPVVRYAMHLLVPDPTPTRPQRLNLVVVQELKRGVRLSLDLDNDGIGVKSVDLSFTEASMLADMLNTVRRRAVARKDWDR